MHHSVFLYIIKTINVLHKKEDIYMKDKVLYGLLEVGTMEQVRDYHSLEEVFKDLI